MSKERKQRNFEIFLAKMGLSPYNRPHTYRELARQYDLSERFIQVVVKRYKLQYPDLWQKSNKA